LKLGRVKTWLQYVLNMIDDGRPENHLDWKPAVGRYLVKAKYYVINFMDEKQKITDRKEIEELNKALLSSSAKTQMLCVSLHILPYASKNFWKIWREYAGIRITSVSCAKDNKAY